MILLRNTFLSFFLILSAQNVFAQDDALLTCTPDAGESEFFLNLEKIDADSLKATGSVLTPNPGYRVVLSAHEHGLILEFIKPSEGMHQMMIDEIAINQTLKAPPLDLPIFVSVKKPFNWGPTQFICK